MRNAIAINQTLPIDMASELQAQGIQPLMANEIKYLMGGRVFLGRYPPVFEYIIALNADGTMEGKNDAGHYDIGHWQIDEAHNTLNVAWQYGWDKACSHVYQTKEGIKMLDATNGVLNTILHRTLDSQPDIKNYAF